MLTDRRHRDGVTQPGQQAWEQSIVGRSRHAEDVRTYFTQEGKKGEVTRERRGVVHISAVSRRNIAVPEAPPSRLRTAPPTATYQLPSALFSFRLTRHSSFAPSVF